MKRNRHHKPNPKFLQSSAPVGLAAELPDLMCDLPDDLRRELPNAALRAEWSNTKAR